MSENQNRVMSTGELLELNRRAIEEGYNRSQDQNDLTELVDPDGVHIIQPMMIHEHKAGVATDPHWRCLAWIKLTDEEAPMRIQLDVSFEDMAKLRRAP